MQSEDLSSGRIETGLELLSRLNEKPRSINLDEVLFPNDVNNRSIVEIIGPSSSGKTVLLCQFIAKCLLPAQYKEIKINGCDASAILIDCLAHVPICKIVELMTCMVNDAYRTAGARASVETVNAIVHTCLENLKVIECCNNVEFQLTLHTLENEFHSNERITLLAIDDLLAYYWQERRNKGLFSMNYYATNLLKIIRVQMSQFNVITVYTRWEGASESHTKHTNHTTKNLLEGIGVNYRLQLCRNFDDTHDFTCHEFTEFPDGIKQIHYKISDNGINWIM